MVLLAIHFSCLYHFFCLYHGREDQQFLYDVVNSVLNANGVGMFKKKRLRGLMIKELCRQKVVNCFLREICDKKKSDIVSDKVRKTLCFFSNYADLWAVNESTTTYSLPHTFSSSKFSNVCLYK